MYRLISSLMTLCWCMLSDHVTGDCTSITATLMEQVLSLTERVTALESASTACTTNDDEGDVSGSHILFIYTTKNNTIRFFLKRSLNIYNHRF